MRPLRLELRGFTAYREGVVRALRPAVEWLGPLPFEEALGWFDRAAVLVNTSEPDGEGFPNTFIQAWLRGVPVVSLGIDPDGVIRAHGLGRVAADVDEAARALDALLADPDGYARLAEHVAAFARERYTVERVADRFLAVVGAEPRAQLTT